jgi:site-specific DNA-methyltransferase (cytosine-N4-specific)
MSLRCLLELAHEHNGNRLAFQQAVRQAYFESHPTSDSNKHKLAGNTCISMVAYGLMDSAATLTGLGEELYELREDDQALHRALARHILLNLNGINLIHCIQDMQAGAETVDLVSLRKALQLREIHFPSGGKHPSIMKLWLEKAGVFSGAWRIDIAALESVLGTGAQEIEALAGLTPEQRSYLKALVNIGGGGPFPSNEIQRMAATTYGTEFNEKNLPQSVLYPLRDAGFITLERGTKEAGRGAKPFTVTATEQMVAEVMNPLLEQFERQIDPQLRVLIRRPLSEILTSLSDEDKHVRGLGLEALAFKLMRLIDLDYLATRLRAASTGGAEVDVIFESSRLTFSRWQVQCKNTSRVALDDVAKEVGLTHLLKSNVIVMVSTGEIGGEARRYADKVMRDTNLCVVMVDRTDINQIAESPISIIDVLNREARHAMQIKALTL